jgi:hypothetical protein
MVNIPLPAQSMQAPFLAVAPMSRTHVEDMYSTVNEARLSFSLYSVHTCGSYHYFRAQRHRRNSSLTFR